MPMYRAHVPTILSRALHTRGNLGTEPTYCPGMGDEGSWASTGYIVIGGQNTTRVLKNSWIRGSGRGRGAEKARQDTLFNGGTQRGKLHGKRPGLATGEAEMERLEACHSNGPRVLIAVLRGA
jgi:hypothetical protein